MLKIGEVFCNKSVDYFIKIVEIHPDKTLVSVEKLSVEKLYKSDYIKYLGRFIWESYKLDYLIKIDRIVWYKTVRIFNINTISKTCKKK